MEIREDANSHSYRGCRRAHVAARISFWVSWPTTRLPADWSARRSPKPCLGDPINARRILPIMNELLADSHGGNIFSIIDRVRYYCANATLWAECMQCGN